MPDPTNPVHLESRFAGLEIAGVGPGVVPTGGNATPAAGEARAVTTKVGLC